MTRELKLSIGIGVLFLITSSLIYIWSPWVKITTQIPTAETNTIHFLNAYLTNLNSAQVATDGTIQVTQFAVIGYTDFLNTHELYAWQLISTYENTPEHLTVWSASSLPLVLTREGDQVVIKQPADSTYVDDIARLFPEKIRALFTDNTRQHTLIESLMARSEQAAYAALLNHIQSLTQSPLEYVLPNDVHMAVLHKSISEWFGTTTDVNCQAIQKRYSNGSWYHYTFITDAAIAGVTAEGHDPLNFADQIEVIPNLTGYTNITDLLSDQLIQPGSINQQSTDLSTCLAGGHDNAVLTFISPDWIGFQESCEGVFPYCGTAITEIRPTLKLSQ